MGRCTSGSRSGTDRGRPGLGGSNLLPKHYSTSNPTRCPDHSIHISLLPSPVASCLNIHISGVFFFQLPLVSLFHSLSFPWSVNINVSLGSASPLTNLFPSAPASGSLGPSFLPSLCPTRNSEFHKTSRTCGSRRNHIAWKAKASESN